MTLPWCRAFEKSLQPGHTRLVMLESPTNPRMQICDIRRLVEISHKVQSTLLPLSAYDCMSFLHRCRLHVGRVPWAMSAPDWMLHTYMQAALMQGSYDSISWSEDGKAHRG